MPFFSKLTAFFSHISQSIRTFFAKVKAKLLPSQNVQMDSKEKTNISVSLYAMPAHNGDALMLEFTDEQGKERRIWIDGGLGKSYLEYGQQKMLALWEAGKQIDLMVISHIDADHIGGIVSFVRDRAMNKELVQEFWFNNPAKKDTQERSIDQGLELLDYLEFSKKWQDDPVVAGHVYDFFGAKLAIVSPNEAGLTALAWEYEEELAHRGMENEKSDYEASVNSLIKNKEIEDEAVANFTSIAFIFEWKGKKTLMLGDAHPSVVVEGLEEFGYSAKQRLKLDAVKLSHHGSKRSISSELIAMLDCDTWIISTDASRHGLPNKEALARILTHPSRNWKKRYTFIFNYDNKKLRSIFTKWEMKEYFFQCVFPQKGKLGVRLDV
ncbi:MAG: ComEC/Rec2 family competence protein [Bacteroidia bacterium]